MFFQTAAWLCILFLNQIYVCMKKFYLLIMALVCGAAMFAQPVTPATCPSTLAMSNYIISLQPAFNQITITGGPTAASTQSSPPAQVQFKDYQGAAIQIYKTNGTPIPFAYLNDFGNGTFNYPGAATVVEVWITYPDPATGNILTCIYKPAPAAALPIKLTSFSGRLTTETEATIAWSSSMEENSFKYQVQRSADGKNFVTIGTVNAAGTSLQTIKYSYNDVLPGAGAYFYRLNMVDQDGHSELSKTVYVNSKKGAGAVTKIFPNPFTSEIQLIGITSADLNTNNVQVFSVTGQRINYRIVGANAISIDENAPRGVYILKYKNESYKLSKQ